jgi:hypothetical protein
MKNRIYVVITILGLSTLLLSSCSKVPQAEIDAANLAIEQAREAGAEVYVNESFIALQDSLNGVMVRLESQKSKFIKSYSTAKEELNAVVLYAGEVKMQTETRIEEMKAEIQTSIAEVNNMIAANRLLILDAPRGKEGNSALLAIKGENDAIEAALAETNAMFEAGEYPAALDKAKALLEKATAINTELAGVIAKFKSNVRK